MAKVLVLGDERDACVLAKRIVEKIGHEAMVFTKAREAIDWAANEDPELAILEIREDFSSIRVLETLKKLNKNIKIIITTAHSSSDHAKQAKALGAVACFTGPVEIDELEDRVATLVSA